MTIARFIVDDHTGSDPVELINAHLTLNDIKEEQIISITSHFAARVVEVWYRRA